MRVNAASLDIRDATTSTPGTLNDLTTDLIMANNNRWGSFFDIVDKGLRVKLTELWMKNSKPPPGPRRRSCHTRV